jgi:hypothetical protein
MRHSHSEQYQKQLAACEMKLGGFDSVEPVLSDGRATQTSFRFILTNPHNIPPWKFTLIAERKEYAIFCNSSGWIQSLALTIGLPFQITDTQTPAVALPALVLETPATLNFTGSRDFTVKQIDTLCSCYEMGRNTSSAGIIARGDQRPAIHNQSRFVCREFTHCTESRDKYWSDSVVHNKREWKCRDSSIKKDGIQLCSRQFSPN